ncbi:MAG: ComF family protein [Lachnospiraceae bacterium]|nr:ComF family protein [Lachnospiraceae bacterium]
MREKGSLKGVWEWILDAVFPRRCPVCDEILGTDGIRVCPGCREAFQILREPICRRCGKPIKDAEEEYCSDCLKRRHEFDQGAALYEYASVRESIYRFKYMGRQEYKEFYGEEISRYLGRQIREWNADLLLPVPIHAARMRKRGYNQAELLAEEIGRRLSIPVMKKTAWRVRKTVPQKGLNVSERQNNLKKAFKIRQNDVKLKTIIIIDDIYTTGSTIDALAGECRRAGAEKVYFVVLAMGNSL